MKSELFAYRGKVNITMMALQDHFCRTPDCNIACLVSLRGVVVCARVRLQTFFHVHVHAGA